MKTATYYEQSIQHKFIEMVAEGNIDLKKINIG